MMKRLFSVLLIVVLAIANVASLNAQDDNKPAVITAQNVAGLQQVAQFGSGLKTDGPVWAPSGEYFVIASSLGIWVYDVTDLDNPKIVSIGDVQIDDIAFSPDGSRLSAIHKGNLGGPATIYLLDVSTWSVVSTIESPDGPIYGHSSFSSDGTQLLVPATRGFFLWDIATRSLLFSGKHDAQLTTVIFDPNESLIASADFAGVVRLWNAQTGEMVSQLNGYSENKAIWGLVFNAEITRLFATGNAGWLVWNLTTGTEMVASQSRIALNPENLLGLVWRDDGELGLWDLNSGAETTQLDSSLGEIRSVCWSPDGNIILAGDEFGAIQGWDIHSGQSLFQSAGHTGPIFYLTWISGTSQVLSTSTDGRMILWDIEAGEQIAVYEGHIGPLGAIDLNLDEQRLVLANQFTGRSLEIWDLDNRDSLKVIDVYSDTVERLAFSSDGVWLAGGGHTETTLWDVVSGQRVQKFDAGILGSNYLVPMLDHLILGLNLPDGNIDVWDIIGQERLITVNTADAQYIYVAAVCPDGSCVTTYTNNGDIQLWDVESGQIATQFIGHSSQVRATCLNPDGTFLVSAGSDNTIRIWNVNFGVQLAVLENQTGLFAVACSPDGTQFATAIRDREQATVTLWGANDGQLLKTLTVDGRAAYSVDFSPSSDLIAVGTENGFEVWDVTTGENLASFPQDSIHVVAFSPDGTVLATGGRDGTIRLWTVGGGAIE